MAPATAAVTDNVWDSQIVTSGDNVTGLKYITNPYDVNFYTGIAKDGKTLNFAAVPVSPDSKYYIDYDAYIVSAGEELEAYSLTATISCESDKASYMSATITFYQDSVSSGNMKGSIAVANQSTESVSFFLTDNKIPVNTAGTPIHIIARCYFDGALMNGDHAYINSATVDTSDIVISIIFTATELSGS